MNANELTEQLILGMKKSSDLIMDNIGIVVKFSHADERVRRYAIRYNHGRAKKVSFKRPSPQLSRAKLAELKQRALFGAVIDEWYKSN